MKRDTASPTAPKKTVKAKTATPKTAASKAVAKAVPTNVLAMPARAMKPTLVRPKVKAGPMPDAIAIRAYYLFEARGFEHGHDLDDWLQAESELMAPVKAPRRSASA